MCISRDILARMRESLTWHGAANELDPRIRKHIYNGTSVCVVCV
jgi:hypothetical protein